MRKAAYQSFIRLPFQVANGGIGIAGLVASLWPDKVREMIGGDTGIIQDIGIALLAVSALYFMALWLLKPGSDDKGGLPPPPSGPISPTINASGGSTVNFHVHIREDSQMPDRDDDLVRRLLEGLEAKRGHTITTHNQSGGINAGELHVHAEDKSLKRKLRNLLAAADARILSEIDTGNLNIETRMTGRQFESLNQIANTDGSAQLFERAEVTGRFERSQMNDGSFGPTTAEALQLRVNFTFKREMME